MDIREYLENHRLITDGAMGTWYDRLTGYRGEMAERGNLTRPEQIRAIHRAYLEAGAQLLRTNTFAVNSMFFEPEEIPRVLAAAWEHASAAVQAHTEAAGSAGEEAAISARAEAVGSAGEEAVGSVHAEAAGSAGEAAEIPASAEAAASRKEQKPVWIAADLGPIREDEDRDGQAVMAEYKTLCRHFLDLGARVFVFETLSELRDIREAVAFIKAQQPDAFVIVQFSLNRNGYTRSGMGARALLAEAGQWEAVDAVGFNCGVGPLHLYELLKDQTFPAGKYLTVLPNAGYPTELRGRMLYSENVPYYVGIMEKLAGLGVDILGGCCGTTPDHIGGMRALLEEGIRPPKKLMPGLARTHTQPENEDVTPFVEKLRSGEKVFVAELDPPFDANDRKLMEGAALLRDAGVDMITLADSPLARPRADAVASAIKVHYTRQMEVMPHICCRDKNMIAHRAQLIGMHMNGLRHSLIVTGDPIARGDRESIKSVFNFSSIQLMQYVQTMNREVFGSSPIYYGGALNQHNGSVESIAARMRMKLEAGASWFLTQPVYGEADLERLRELKAWSGGRIVAGIMPLVSRKNALFIQNEMPGIRVPDAILDQYPEGLSREAYEEVAVTMSLELMRQLKDICDGYYLMTPFNRASLIRRIMLQAKKELK